MGKLVTAADIRKAIGYQYDYSGYGVDDYIPVRTTPECVKIVNEINKILAKRSLPTLFRYGNVKAVAREQYGLGFLAMLQLKGSREHEVIAFDYRGNIIDSVVCKDVNSGLKVYGEYYIEHILDERL